MNVTLFSASSAESKFCLIRPKNSPASVLFPLNLHSPLKTDDANPGRRDKRRDSLRLQDLTKKDSEIKDWVWMLWIEVQEHLCEINTDLEKNETTST